MDGPAGGSGFSGSRNGGFDPYPEEYFDFDPTDPGYVPTGDFFDQVFDFNIYNQLIHQHDYENRLFEEANVMVSLEGLREALVELDFQLDVLEDQIFDNNSDISENDDAISEMDNACRDNEDEILY